MDGKKITELGVSIEDYKVDKPKTKAKCFNSKLKIFREFTLATLSALAETKSKQVLTSKSREGHVHSQVYALDALACTGIAGIQWKVHHSNRVHVTMAEHDDTSKIVENVQANLLSYSELKLNPVRVSGDLLDQQGAKEVHICQAEAKTVMMMEAFNFIYMSPDKNCSSYFEPAMQSVTSNGVLCVVVSDISLFARSPHVVQRFYGADIVKTEYLKELTARIILASLARAAARYIKGISPQYVLSHEDYLLICVRVSRGHSVADSSINEVEKLLHCRLCEERIFMPNQLAPIDDPYSLLTCSCKKNNPGKTAVILGPVWKGALNEPNILNQIRSQGQQLCLSAKFFELVNLLIKESVCAAKSDRTVATSSVPEMEATEKKNSQNCADSNPENTNHSCVTTSSNSTEHKTEFTNETSNPDDQTIVPEHCEIIHGKTSASVDETIQLTARKTEQDQTELNSSTVLKRKAEDIQVMCGDTKRQRKDKEENIEKSVSVPFYYNITKFRRKTNPPKLDKLVTILHSCGHRASRTHFDSCAIRTSASVEEFLSILG